MKNRAIAVSATVSAVIGVTSLVALVAPEHRLIAIASGLGCGVAGGAVAHLWNPREKRVENAVNHVRGLVLDEAVKGIEGSITVPAWADPTKELESNLPEFTPVSNPEQEVTNRVTNPVNEGELLVNFWDEAGDSPR